MGGTSSEKPRGLRSGAETRSCQRRSGESTLGHTQRKPMYAAQTIRGKAHRGQPRVAHSENRCLPPEVGVRYVTAPTGFEPALPASSTARRPRQMAMRAKRRNPHPKGARVSIRGSPDRIRTGVTGLRGRRPRPLDDGATDLHPDGCRLARGEGLEPSITGPEPVVLPITPPPNAPTNQKSNGGRAIS